MKAFNPMFSAVLMLFCLALPPAPVQAGMIGTNEALSTQQATRDHAKLDAFLGRAEVQEQMRALGVDAANARARAQALTPSEAAQLVQRMDAVPAGGNISKTDFLLILLLIIVVAILL
ncbi:PA2779 family protein [Metapseudomonas resinovorans]|uniref:PA2779 family protein n=1 Tax=Metapseudomonas resinovorans NBRC 106553 TaxID=1245471 RepID=S6AGX5_METRE|nr:PA2779 family protein [Pseudomonas resinovorans]BAN49662.1 hypothetical protein PCA10_39300 [Pseudomonas resinovorans NBRC 106553]